MWRGALIAAGLSLGVIPAAGYAVTCPERHPEDASEPPASVASVGKYQVRYYNYVEKPFSQRKKRGDKQAAFMGGALLSCGGVRQPGPVRMFEIVKANGRGFVISKNKARDLMNAFCATQGSRGTYAQSGNVMEKLTRRKAHRYYGTCQ